MLTIMSLPRRGQAAILRAVRKVAEVCTPNPGVALIWGGRTPEEWNGYLAPVLPDGEVVVFIRAEPFDVHGRMGAEEVKFFGLADETAVLPIEEVQGLSTASKDVDDVAKVAGLDSGATCDGGGEDDNRGGRDEE